VVPDLADRLHRGGEVGAVVVEDRSARAHLGTACGRLRVDTEPVVEPPRPDLVAHGEQLGCAAGIGQLGEHALPRLHAAAQLDPVTTVAGPHQLALPTHQHRVGAGHRAAEDDLPFDLGVEVELRLAGDRETEVDQVAEAVVRREPQPQAHRTPPSGALDRIPTCAGTVEALGAGPEGGGQATLPGERADRPPRPAVGQQPKGSVEARLARAVRAGDDVEPLQRHDDVAQRAVARNGHERDHGASVGPSRDSLVSPDGGRTARRRR
jgi:hypothetical protein